MKERKDELWNEKKKFKIILTGEEMREKKKHIMQEKIKDW